MSVKITQREVLEAFLDLEREARLLAQSTDGSPYRKLQLHDAAIKYGHLVRRVTRAGRSGR